MGFLTDMDQTERIERLESKVRSLERKLNGGSEMSKLIRDLVGLECTVSLDYDEKRCRVMDADDEWVKLMVFGKKGDSIIIRRIDEIREIRLG